MITKASRNRAPHAFAAEVLSRFTFFISQFKEETVIKVRVAGFSGEFARIEVQHEPSARVDAIDLARAIEIAIAKAWDYCLAFLLTNRLLPDRHGLESLEANPYRGRAKR